MSWNQITLPLVEYRKGAELVLILRQLMDTFRVALGLREHTLRPERDLLCFNDAMHPAAIAERVVGRAVGRLVLLYRGLVIGGSRQLGSKPPNMPPRPGRCVAYELSARLQAT